MALEPIYEINENIKNYNNITISEICYVKVRMAALGIQGAASTGAPYGKVVWEYGAWKSLADIANKERRFLLKNKITGDIITRFTHILTAQQATDLSIATFPLAAVSVLKDVLGLTNTPTVHTTGPQI